MAIRTVGEKHKGARVGLLSGTLGSGMRNDSDDVLRFAPNFSVYILPPDVVCLYSEDRKFFLHGELYCALASAIGVGKSFRKLIRTVEQDFPADRIDEALKRLLDRRFVVMGTGRGVGTADAFWASLGLSPEVAHKNLANAPATCAATLSRDAFHRLQAGRAPRRPPRTWVDPAGSRSASLGSSPPEFARPTRPEPAGDGGELRQPLGIAIVGGLLISQLLTLYTTRLIYLYDARDLSLPRPREPVAAADAGQQRRRSRRGAWGAPLDDGVTSRPTESGMSRSRQCGRRSD
jgi:hypothetical protein